jgi:RNA polymerase sigma-70 factor (ECF subfamily)
MRSMIQRTREPLTGSDEAGSSDRPATTDLAQSFQELAAGRAQALEGVYEACADEMYGLALWRTGSASDAADVVQEVFVRLATRRSRLGGIKDPLAYVRRMAYRASIDVHRRRKRRREDPIEVCPLMEAPLESPERGVDAGRISQLLTRLPANQRQTIYLRHFAECSFAEIGRAMGVPTFTAASLYRLGMRRLKRLIGVMSCNPRTIAIRFGACVPPALHPICGSVCCTPPRMHWSWKSRKRSGTGSGKAGQQGDRGPR